MATASDDEEMNYWPGFVDALSTMTMMLIFLMLILSLVIVSVSQNVSRAQVLAIAKAAKIDVSGTPASLENLSAQIISALARLSQDKEPKAPVPEKTPQEATVLVEPSAKLRVAEKENLAVDVGNKVASQGLEDSAIANGKSTQSRVSIGVDPTDIPSDNPPKSSQTAPLEPLSGELAFAEPRHQPPDTRILSEKKADLAPFGGAIDLKTEKVMITLIFQPRALKPDHVMTQKFSEFIEANRSLLDESEYEIQAMANTSSGQVTEARRLSYYRAMVVRQMLVDTKVDPRNIHLSIIDAPSDDLLDYVKIIEKR